MDQNDWYSFYRDSTVLTAEESSQYLQIDRDFFTFVDGAILPGGRVLEAGCGPAKRMLSYARSRSFEVHFVDKDARIIAMAEKNACAIGYTSGVLQVNDILELAQWTVRDEFSVITHHGVLEHYEKEEIREIVSAQIKCARSVVFAVPIFSRHNKALFDADSIHRNLWRPNRWIDEILRPFKVVQSKIVHTRKDEVILHLRRD